MDCARRVGKQLDLKMKGAVQGHSWWHGLLCSVHLHPGRCDTCRACGWKTSLLASSEKEGGTGCSSDLMADLPHGHLDQARWVARGRQQPGTLGN